MDVKTLSTIIGHVSSSTTLNIYAHVTDKMQRAAAAKIDMGIGKIAPSAEQEILPSKPAPSTFQPYKGQRRKPGTGCVSRSMTTCGRAVTPLSSMESAWPAMSMPAPKRNVRKNWP